MSHASSPRLLPVLEQASAGILTRIDRARGRNADTYAVQLSEHFQQLARELISLSVSNHHHHSPKPNAMMIRLG